MNSDLKNDFPLFQTCPDGRPKKAANEKEIVVLMSGGVDSSAAALLLKQAGYRVTGLTMKILDGGGEGAVESAAAVCRALAIPHYWIDLRKEFQSDVVEPFCAAYLEGETPNPCARCNERVKLGLLARIAAAYWGERTAVATGHYARIEQDSGRVCLARARNARKDQSYFLAGIPYPVVERLAFPLGEIASKDETRELVREAGLPVSERPDSMEICFANERDYRALIDRPGIPGPVVDIDGNVIGQHSGIAHYTLGQRKGLGIAAEQPLYVVEIRPAENTIVAANREDAFTSTVRTGALNLLLPERIGDGSPLAGKVRSQGEPLSCHVLEIGNDSATVAFDAPVFAPAPGQRLVLYTREGHVTLGGTIVSGGARG